jgi:16S rRNA (adenine1518-N6/adenine1519-N6)-dimethyltransferase
MASLADAGPGTRVVEIGAGVGALTVALAGSGAEVLAVEFDRALIPALREVVEPFPNIRVEEGDALRMDWGSLLGGEGWKMVSNLPYNLAVPLLMDLLENVSAVDTYIVMVQREVGERLAARRGEDAYGSVSVRVAYRADTELVRRVPPSVFWPRPKVESVLVRLTPRPAPVGADAVSLFRVVEEGFAERRKTMTNALKRLGLDTSSAVGIMESCGLDPAIRAEELGLAEFGAITDALESAGTFEGQTP